MANRIIDNGPTNSAAVMWAANVGMSAGVTIHVTEIGGNTITVEHSDDNSTWSSLGTITAKGRFGYAVAKKYLRFRVSTYVSGYVRYHVEESTVSPNSQAVASSPVGGFVTLTQAQYDALPAKDAKTAYLIVG